MVDSPPSRGESDAPLVPASALLLARDSVNSGDDAPPKASDGTPRAVTRFFWALGVLNNATYVIMIASAKSISGGGVALVYLSGILPGMACKATAPFWFDRVGYAKRLAAGTTCMVLSYALVGPLSFGRTETQLLGVMLCSLQSSLGEASLLALAARYPDRGAGAISAWSSGAWVWRYTIETRSGLSTTRTLRECRWVRRRSRHMR